jgi:hypothetical protein
MENTDLKIDSFINKLKALQPELHDTEALTVKIETEISKIQVSVTPKLLIWIRTISSVAAVLLFGLYLFEQNEIKATNLNHNSSYLLEFKVDISSTCIQSLKDNRTNLLESYYCYLQQNYIENNRFEKYKQFNENQQP